MSWYVKAIGTPKAVLAALEVQFSYTKCAEPEETARQAAKTAMEAVISKYPANLLVLAHGSGSQSNNAEDGTVAGEFSIRVELLNPLLPVETSEPKAA